MFGSMRAPLILAVAAFAVLASISAASSQQTAALPTITLPAELDRVLRDYEVAWREGNEAGLASLFTEDGFVMSSGQPPVRGRDAIAERYADSGGPLTLAALAYATGDSVGYIIGTYGGSDPSTHRGKYVLALRKGADGSWLIAADMDNVNQR